MKDYTINGNIQTTTGIMRTIDKQLASFTDNTSYDTVQNFLYKNFTIMTESQLFNHHCCPLFSPILTSLVDSTDTDFKDVRLIRNVMEVFKSMYRTGKLSDTERLYVNYIYSSLFCPTNKKTISKKRFDDLYSLIYTINGDISERLAKVLRRENDELATELSNIYYSAQFGILLSRDIPQLNAYKTDLYKLEQCLNNHKVTDVQTIINILMILFENHVDVLIDYIYTKSIMDDLADEISETRRLVTEAILAIANKMDSKELYFQLLVTFVCNRPSKLKNIFVPEEFTNVHEALKKLMEENDGIIGQF